MRIFILMLLIIMYSISCESKKQRKECKINFEIAESKVSHGGITTDLKFQKNILTVSIFNLRNDTLRFAVPHLIFAREAVQQSESEEFDVVKQFIPNIVTDRVIAYTVIENNKKIINVDSSKTRDVEQFEFKLPPRGTYIVEYSFNCNRSDSGKYKMFFFGKQ